MRYTFITFCLTVIIFVGCGKDECPNSQYLMENLYSSFSTNSDFEDRISYDSETHEYSFILARDVQLCGIGYQSQANIDNYDFRIVDDQNNLILDEQLSFSSDKTEYRSVTAVSLNANTEYTISRTCNTYDSISDVIGRILTFSSAVSLPIVQGDLTITKVSFYGNGNPDNDAIPFIGLAVD